jgi:hypothetical protein
MQKMLCVLCGKKANRKDDVPIGIGRDKSKPTLPVRAYRSIEIKRKIRKHCPLGHTPLDNIEERERWIPILYADARK